jgi:dTDP-4-dehydrorhamnose reductase
MPSTEAALRIAVTGLRGQVVTALLERSAGRAEILPLGRPRLDLTDRHSIMPALARARCDVIINAAAYTAVDKAEQEPDAAMRVNADGAGFVAEAAAGLDVPLLHLSTDYVFDGSLGRPYREADQTAPMGAYGRSKLAGETRVAAAHANSVILRTAWVYSPFGTNFVRTMLRLGETRPEVRVVADQTGNPTSALDIASALLAIAARIASDPSPELRGIFHITGQGEASWADLAEAVFDAAAQRGRALVRVERITTADYPAPARRPANSRLDNRKLREIYGVAMPHWRTSLPECVSRLIDAATQG